MSTSLGPLYVKHSVLGATRHDTLLAYRLCMLVNAVIPGHVRGARQVRGLWEIQAKTAVARDRLLQNGFIFNEKHIMLHKSDPFLSENIPSEKITFRDVPFGCSDEHIMKYVRSQSQLSIRSPVISGKIRDTKNQLTDFLNGDRYVYVEAGFSPALDTEAVIDGCKCRVWHPNQALKCRRCGKEGHRTTDNDKCSAFIDEPDDVITFWEAKHVFSNFYMCNINLFDIDFKSSEHCYQLCKLRYIGQDELAQDVLQCDTPKQAKEIAMQIPNHMLVQWHEQKCDVMYRILVAKAKCCDRFKEALIDSRNKLIYEGSVDSFWGVGMPGYYAKNTHPDFLWGSNVLENILMKIRDEILSELAESTSAPPAASAAPSKIAISGDGSTEDSSKVVVPAILPTFTPPVTRHKTTISEEVSTKDSSKVVAPTIPPTSTPPVTNQKATISGDVSTEDSSEVVETTTSSISSTNQESVTSAAGISQNDSSKSRDDTIDTSVAMGASVSHPTSDIESLSEGTGAPGSETLKRRQPVTVKRRPGNKNKKQQIFEGPMDSFFQKLKRKLSADKESDTESGNLKQSRNEGVNP